MAMGLLALPSTAGHHVLSFPSFAGKITFPCQSRNLSVALQVQAAIVEATPRSPPPIRKITAGNDAVPISSRRSSRDRAGDLQAEAGAMARAANASVYSPELLAIEYGSRPIKVKWVLVFAKPRRLGHLLSLDLTCLLISLRLQFLSDFFPSLAFSF